MKAPCGQLLAFLFLLFAFCFIQSRYNSMFAHLIFFLLSNFSVILASLSHHQTFNLPKKVLLFITQENSLFSRKFLF